LNEYKLAPAVTRKRLYLETMETVLASNKKVFLDVESSGNILYLPLDQATGSGPANMLPPIKTPTGNRTNSLDRKGDARGKGREGRR